MRIVSPKYMNMRATGETPLPAPLSGRIDLLYGLKNSEVMHGRQDRQYALHLDRRLCVRLGT